MRYSYLLLLMIGGNVHASCADITEDVVTKKIIKKQIIRTQVSGKLVEKQVELVNENLLSSNETSINESECVEVDVTNSTTEVESSSDISQSQLYSHNLPPLILNYDFDKYKLTAKHIELLKDYVNSSDFSHIVIEGHADRQGEESYNNNLSLKRAQEVESYIKSKHGGEFKLSVVGYGEEYPVCSIKSNRMNGCNRRVNVFLSTKVNDE